MWKDVAAVNLLNHGVPRVRIKEMCGWKTDSVFEHYVLHINKEAHHGEIVKVDGILG